MTDKSFAALIAADLTQALTAIYERLFERYGHQHWWPADTPFEVVVGAILTQSVSWMNVETAIRNLKRENALSPDGLLRLDETKLASLIRPTGYYNAKARKLKAFVEHLSQSYDNDLDALFRGDTEELRRELLSIHGIGPETADSILLYAAGKPVFVVDAYTRRLMNRLGFVSENVTYHELQKLFMDNLPLDVALFQEYHALIVAHAKFVCRKRDPLCDDCPLLAQCNFGQRIRDRTDR
jgi:endonuclease-3 related protein